VDGDKDVLVDSTLDCDNDALVDKNEDNVAVDSSAV